MFDRLLKPKWQHNDPRKRLAALDSGNVPPAALATLALDDSEPDVRCRAIQRLDDLDLLTQLMRSDLHARVRDAVELRLREILIRPSEQAPAMDLRLACLRRLDSPTLCAHLARQAAAIELRTAAVEKVSDTAQLCAVAVDDPVASVRRLALERISEPAGWETVSRNARNKDKQISRAARERLEAYHQAQADQQSAEQLCAAMQALLDSSEPQTDARLRYQQLVADRSRLTALNAELESRFERLRQQVSAKLEQFEALQQERTAICDALQGLLDRMLSHEEEDHAGLFTELAQRIQDLNQRWLSLATEPHSDNPLGRRFDALQQRLEAEFQRMRRDGSRRTRQRELIEKTRAALQHPDRLDDNRIKQLQQRWHELEAVESERLRARLQADFEAALQQLRETLNQQIRQRKKALDEVEKLLPELETALARGELERALSLRDRITHRLKKSKGVSDQRRHALQQRLSGMHDKLDEMKQWRHWGSGHAREQLCEEIEAQIDSPLSPDEIAAKVRTARKAWQRIDHAEGPANEAMWQRFDQACTRAYEPFQEERKRQEAILEQHLMQKQQLYAELEAFERDTDWDNADWREVDQKVHKTRERWRRIGATPRKAGKPLEKRYRDLTERLDARLAPERERELKRRRWLIARVEELSRASDLRAASREVKEAQDKWKPTVPLPRKEEQALWQQFRSACDAVFDQLREQRDAADAQRRANLERRQAICTELESALGQPDKAYRELLKLFDDTADEWNQIGEIPRKQERAIEARYEAIKERLAERQREEASAAEAARLEAIRERSRLCARLEHALLDEALEERAREALLEQSAQAWEALPALEPAYAKPLQERYALVRRALNGDAGAVQSLKQALPENLQQRLQLCLQLEVAAGVDSPPEFSEQRMQYQVSLLSDALHQRFEQQQSRDQRLRELQIAWLQSGPIAQEQRNQLDARFERALPAEVQREAIT